MNTELTNISNKIQDKIAIKATPAPDPTKVLAADVAEILQDMVNYLNGLGTATAPAPVYGASANPDSDTEITINWFNPS